MCTQKVQIHNFLQKQLIKTAQSKKKMGGSTCSHTYFTRVVLFTYDSTKTVHFTLKSECKYMTEMIR